MEEGSKEMWEEYHRQQRQRRDGRQVEFELDWEPFQRALREIGMRAERRTEYHVQIVTGGPDRRLLCDYWPRPHHKYRIVAGGRVQTCPGWRELVKKLKGGRRG